MLDLTKPIFFDMQDSIKNNINYYVDEIFLKNGKSGGYRCIKCKIWIRKPVKKKHTQFTYLIKCNKCEQE